MKYDEIVNALMIVDMLRSKELSKTLPQDVQDNRDLILYADSALKLKQGEYNFMYPLLKQGLNTQFKNYTKEPWVRYIGDVDSIMDVGAGGGAYLNALDISIRKYAIDNKPMGDIPMCKKYNGYFPFDMPAEFYDVIVMNEFLHLFPLKEALDMIRLALNYASRVVVTENLFSEHLDYRLKKLGGGRLHTAEELGLENVIETGRHYIGEIRI